jgi:hypothetical protein
MDELFSCRNCIHNCGQSLNIGPGSGYCLQHDSVISEPERTTCKYLHRKDLPFFAVEEGVREHAAEFTFFPRLVTLDTKESIEPIRYSEKYAWENGNFDPVTNALARYHKVSPKWVVIQAFTGGFDGQRSLVQASLVRHFIKHCDTWTSSYRLVLGMLKEMDVQPHFSPKDLLLGEDDSEEVTADALWDVIFARLSALQEYGWHAGLERLTWASDELNGALSELNWPRLQKELANRQHPWIDLIITHAQEHNEFFPQPEPAADDYGD